MDIYIKKLLLNFNTNKATFANIKKKNKIKKIISDIIYTEIDILLKKTFQNLNDVICQLTGIVEIKDPITISINYNLSNNNIQEMQDFFLKQILNAVSKNINISVKTNNTQQLHDSKILK